MKDNQRRALLLRPSAGSIPANTRIAEVIQLEFQEYDFVVVDVQPLVRKYRFVLLANAILTFCLYWRDLLTKRKRFRACFWRTPFIHGSIKSILKNLYGTGAWDFTFQIQSLFDGSLKGIPHFVYTDHTHLANLEYPGVSTQDLYHLKWIECERETYFNADTVFVRSTNMVRTLATKYELPEDRTMCVFAGANAHVPPFDDSLTAKRNPRRILFVGGDWERKGGPDLLKAFEEVRKKHPRAELTVVSSYKGSDQVSAPGVNFAGPVPLGEISKYFEDSDIFCMPTRLEPFGIVFIEAMAYGLPIVATRIGALPDLVEDGVNGYLVAPGDVPALIRTLTKLLEDEVRFREMARASRLRYDDRFNWTAVFSAIKTRIQSTVTSS